MRADRATRRLIVNADDLGFGRRVTDGILDAHTGGIVTSTTLMSNMDAAEYAAQRVKELPDLGVGVHLNFTAGRPLTPADRVPDLVDDEGIFRSNAEQVRRLWRGDDLYEQVRTELEAQVRRAFDLGIEPTHCDSHHGIHKMPLVRRAMIDVLPRFGIQRARTPFAYHRLVPGASWADRLECWRINARRARNLVWHRYTHHLLRRAGIRTPDWKATRKMAVPCPEDPKGQLLACLAALPEGVSEILLHPGYFDDEVRLSPWFVGEWEIDTPLCSDPDVVREIERLGIELVSFRDL